MSGSLVGIKVLELIRTAPGAFCTMMLADMGADVIKIETPPGVQARPAYGSGISPAGSQPLRAALNQLNRGKRSIAVNLKTAEGKIILHQLVKGADVLVEGFRPGTLEQLGAGYTELNAINPRLVYCSLSGFGNSGPYKDKPGHDVNYLSYGGLLSLIGNAGELPTIPLNIIADYASGSMNGFAGILLALLARQRTGRGQYVDVSFLDGVISLTAALPGLIRFFSDGILPKRGDPYLSGSYPYYACYETKDHKLFSLGCVEVHFWENFCRAIDREDLILFRHEASHLVEGPDERTKRVKEELQYIFLMRTRDEWDEYLRDKDVCASKVYTWDEVFRDPQVRHRDMLLEIDDPVAGRVKQLGIPIKLSETPGSVRKLGPYLGQHTDEILSNLDYGSSEVCRLRETGVVG